MKITRKSAFSGVVRTIDMPITVKQYDDWVAGILIQNAFPHLSSDQREFMMTGITPEEWNEMMGVENESDDETYDTNEPF